MSLLDQRDSELLTAFATAPDIVRHMRAARELMALRRLAACSEDPRFWQGVGTIVAICRESESGRDRLLAAELLMRLSKALRSHRARIVDQLVPALERALPDLREMPAPIELGKEFKASEARENVALILDQLKFEWVHQYRLKALVQEDRSDEVRRLLAEQVFAHTTTLDMALTEIADAAAQHVLDDVSTPESAARRTRDLLLAIAAGVRASSVSVAPAPS